MEVYLGISGVRRGGSSGRMYARKAQARPWKAVHCLVQARRGGVLLVFPCGPEPEGALPVRGHRTGFVPPARPRKAFLICLTAGGPWLAASRSDPKGFDVPFMPPLAPGVSESSAKLVAPGPPAVRQEKTSLWGGWVGRCRFGS